MATKSSSRRSTTTTTQQSTSFTSSPTSLGRSQSPTRLTRMQEKEELGALNDRLANYIDRVRSLETENSRLVVQIRSFEETSSREISNIKSLYEQELTDARKLMDDLGKEKAKLQIDLGNSKTDADNWMIKFNKRDREAQNLEKKLQATEAENNDLKAKLAESERLKQYFENEFKKLRGENSTLEKQLKEAKKQLEDETLLRVDLENRVQSLIEELAFKSQIHEQELNETRTRTEYTMEEVDDRYQQEYDNRLAEALKEMRSQHEFQAKMYREEIETMFEKKLSEMRVLAERHLGAATSAQEELKASRRKLDELSQDVTKLSSENEMLKRRVRELESQLIHEQEDHQKSMDLYRQEIKELRQTIEDQIREYSDLMDIKIALDMEIAAYRKLLEGEEERLNLSSQSESSMSRSPGRRTPTRSGKRKRVTYEGLQSSAISDSKYAMKTSTKSNIDISDFQEDGNYIRILNNSDKDQSITGWQLKHTAGDEQTVFKLPRGANLKAKQSCTVWSANSDQTHNPPTDIVMKGQRWFTADTMRTVLLNTKGEEMATCDLTKSMLRTFQQGRPGAFGGEGDPAERERCTVM